MKFCALLLLMAAAAVSAEKVRYDGHRVLRFVPQTRLQASMLANLQKVAGNKLDFWSEPNRPGSPVDVRVAPGDLKSVVRMAQRLGLKYEVIIHDVQKLIDSEKVAPLGSKLAWDKYYQFEDILDWTEEQAAAHPDIVTIDDIGESFEGRPIRLMKISKESDQPKVGVFFESQIHAREWISPATTTYIINQILNNPDYADVLDNFDIHYVPVVNPDGAVYTVVEDRLWRKTRSVNPDSPCRGADPNRNWDASFGGEGTSPEPCSDLYHGPEPFSESEVKAVSDYLSANQDSISLFIDFHSYSQFVLLPWGDTNELPSDYDELYAIGKVFEDNVKILYGTEYVTGNIADIIYLAAGGSVDWVKASTSIKHSQALELRDTGLSGFLLPEDQITPSGEETLMGVLAEMNAIRDAVLRSKA